MFATLLGGLPRPTVDTQGEPSAAGAHERPAEIDGVIAAAIRAQEAAGLEPITDGRLRDPAFEHVAAALSAAVQGKSASEDRWEGKTVEGFRSAAAMTDRAVKQALPGPYTLGRRVEPRTRERLTSAFAEALAAEIVALAAAGCPLVEIEEADAHRIGGDERERRMFRDAHRRLTDGSRLGGEIHLSLSIVGGSAADAGVETILDAPYASLAVDLLAGPDNWNLVTRTPGDRGVIAGVQAARAADESKEIMLWAAQYAASSGGRGLVRVGLGTAGSYANLTWEAAVRKMGRLGEAARLASMPRSEELARSLDPRAVSIRRAALGHDAPKPPHRKRSS